MKNDLFKIAYFIIVIYGLFLSCSSGVRHGKLLDQNSSSALGKGNIKGIILDENLRPIPGVSIRVGGTNLSAAAAFDGAYYISDIPSGRYDISAQTVGYDKKIVKDVHVPADSTITLDFILFPMILITPEIKTR
jgi:hypothetical protein